MARRILIRSDDLGYSEGVNCGIAKAVKDGVVRSVGIMPNMPWVQHGLELLKDGKVCYGQHTNICVGKPVSNPKDIPSLVLENGEFKPGSAYRSTIEDFVKLEEVQIEIEAQYHRFVELTGRQPAYFEGHAVRSENFFKGLRAVAKKYGLPYLKIPERGETEWKGTRLIVPGEYRNKDYNPLEMLKRVSTAAYGEKECPMVIFHAGYLDEYILTHSSLLRQRPMEVEACCSPELKRWFAEHDVEIITYNDL